MEFYAKINKGKSNVYEVNEPYTIKALLDMHGLKFVDVNVVMNRNDVTDEMCCIPDSSVVLIEDKPVEKLEKKFEEKKPNESEKIKIEMSDDDEDESYCGIVGNECCVCENSEKVREINLTFYVPAITPFNIAVDSGKTLRTIFVLIRNKFDFYLNPTAYSVNDMNDNSYRDTDIISEDTTFIITKNSSGGF